MAIVSPNQVRQVYVVTDTMEGNVNEMNAETTRGTILPKFVNNKFYAGYAGPIGPSVNDDGIVLTDRINACEIRSVVLSCPASEPRMQWVIKKDNIIPETPVVGENYILYFDFTDWYGVGTDHFYHKFAVVHATSNMDGWDKFFKAMAIQIEKQFKREAYNPFVVEYDEESLTITCKPQYFELLRRIDQTQVHCTISINKNDIDGEPTSQDEYWMVAADNNDVTDDANFGKLFTSDAVATGVIMPDAKTNTTFNGRDLAALEYACLGARADMYGYKGFPWINPSATVFDANKYNQDHFSLDIRYYLSGTTGINGQCQEKEMTFISEDADKLIEIVKVLLGEDVTGTNYTADGAELNAAPTAPTAQKEYWMADLSTAKPVTK